MYLGYVLQASSFVDLVVAQSIGIAYPAISETVLGNLPVAITTDFEEQRSIARYLKHHDQQFSRLIRNKRHLIVLLNEEKQAIIQQAVTRGLDPDVPMKPSGVEWLGDIPAHWERRAVGQLFQIGRGKVTSHEYIATHPGPYPLYSSQTANDGIMGHIDTYMFDGDYLTWTTDGAHAGTVFKRSGRFNCTNVCGTLRPRANTDLRFMKRAIAAETKRQVRQDINPKLMNNMMARIRISAPPLLEQIRIADHIETSLQPIETGISIAMREIDLIREYRTRLIADVVTGQLDVREAAASLPELELNDSDAFLADTKGFGDDVALPEEDDLLVIDEDDAFVASLN